jgi:squalene-hopene/tetraprenyl-beta-curcumene cyclase
MQTGLVVETGEAREVHHFCVLAGYGAEAVNPYLAFETLEQIRVKQGLSLKAYEVQKNYIKAIGKGIVFLHNQQRPDGTWVPLWFGNQDTHGEENPTWGTARVLLALKDLRDHGFKLPPEMLPRAKAALVALQQEDGGWAGGAERGKRSSVEETGVALEALAGSEHTSATDRGVLWLVEKVESGAWTEPAPVGFYFAKLWYFERLYPQLTTVGALGAALQGTIV